MSIIANLDCLTSMMTVQQCEAGIIRDATGSMNLIVNDRWVIHGCQKEPISRQFQWYPK